MKIFVASRRGGLHRENACGGARMCGAVNERDHHRPPHIGEEVKERVSPVAKYGDGRREPGLARPQQRLVDRLDGGASARLA